MSTKVKFTVLIAGFLVCLYFILPKETVKDPSQKASFGAIKCTVAKFLLEDIDTTQQISPLFENLGTLNFTITTSNPRAQEFFNQGLRLTYAFNHAEAHRPFMEASRLDPGAPMTYWGQAYALGPNINDPLPLEERKIKYNEAMAKAMKWISKATPMEQALIEALTHRYSTDLTTDVAELNMAYMKAMEKVLEQFPNDANVQTLYAASVMNTVPWNYWDKSGNPSANIA
ncbi:MAG: hypothetical protein HKP53_06460, partial [Eudoraea sp.]|nr:hypothetical protein [Eudoraea sp.]